MGNRGANQMMTFDQWYDKWDDNETKGWDKVSREDAKVIWEAAQNVIKGEMVKAFIPNFGEK